MKNKGFATHAGILSGDDDLFVNEIANKKNTRIELVSVSHTLSKPKESLTNWLNQKSRHLSTGKYYKFGDKLSIGLEIFSRLLFYLSFILLLIINKYFFVVLSIFIIRMIIQLIINKIFMKKLEIKKILLFSPFFDVLIPLINLYLFITNYLTLRNVKWM